MCYHCDPLCFVLSKITNTIYTQLRLIKNAIPNTYIINIKRLYMLCKLSFCFTNPSQENNIKIYYSQIRIRHFKLMHLNIIITNPERGKSSDSRLISLILGLVKLHRIFAFFSDSYNLFGFLVRSLSWTQQMFSTGLLSSMECPKNP